MKYKTIISREQPQGEPLLIATCKDDETFIKKAKQLLSDAGVQLKELSKLDYETAKKKLIEFDYVVEKEEPSLEDFRKMASLKMAQSVENIVAHSDLCMIINKIKCDKKQKNSIIFYQQSTNKNARETVFTGYEEVTDDFYNEFQEMTLVLIDSLQFPGEWADRITTTGLSVSYEQDDLMGMVITAQMEIPGLNCPLNLNTPFIKFQTYCNFKGISEDVTLDGRCEQLLDNIFEYSKKYMQGESKKQQLSLLSDG